MDDLVKVSIGDFVFRSVLSSLLFASLPIFDPFYLFSNCPILISNVNNFNNPICVSKIFLFVSKQIKLSIAFSLSPNTLLKSLMIRCVLPKYFSLTFRTKQIKFSIATLHEYNSISIRGIVIDPMNIFETSFLPFHSSLSFSLSRNATPKIPHRHQVIPSHGVIPFDASDPRCRYPRRRTVENIGAILAKSKQNRRNRIYASNSDQRSRAPFEGGDNGTPRFRRQFQYRGRVLTAI